MNKFLMPLLIAIQLLSSDFLFGQEDTNASDFKLNPINLKEAFQDMASPECYKYGEYLYFLGDAVGMHNIYKYDLNGERVGKEQIKPEGSKPNWKGERIFVHNNGLQVISREFTQDDYLKVYKTTYKLDNLEPSGERVELGSFKIQEKLAVYQSHRFKLEYSQDSLVISINLTVDYKKNKKELITMWFNKDWEPQETRRDLLNDAGQREFYNMQMHVANDRSVFFVAESELLSGRYGEIRILKITPGPENIATMTLDDLNFPNDNPYHANAVNLVLDNDEVYAIGFYQPEQAHTVGTYFCKLNYNTLTIEQEKFNPFSTSFIYSKMPVAKQEKLKRKISAGKSVSLDRVKLEKTFVTNNSTIKALGYFFVTDKENQNKISRQSVILEYTKSGDLKVLEKFNLGCRPWNRKTFQVGEEVYIFYGYDTQITKATDRENYLNLRLIIIGSDNSISDFFLDPKFVVKITESACRMVNENEFILYGNDKSGQKLHIAHVLKK